MEVFNINGENRAEHGENTYEYTDDPNPEEVPEMSQEVVEAFEYVSEASQKFFEQNFGEEADIHRGLGDHAVEEIAPTLIDRVVNESKDSVVLRDNPASVWTTGEKLSETFDKGVSVHQKIESDEVMAMPEALIELEGPVSNEGEVNINGWDREMDISQFEIDTTGHTYDELIDNFAETILESENAESVFKTLVGVAQRDADAAHDLMMYIENLPFGVKAAIVDEYGEAYSNLKNTAEGAVKQDDDNESDIIDIRSPGDTWLSEAAENFYRDEEKQDLPFETDWQRYQGPQGGTGWIHPQTQDIVYTELPPDVSEDGSASESENGSGVDTENEQDTAPEPSVDVPEFRDNEEVDNELETVNTTPGEGFTLKRNLDLDPVHEKDMWLVGITSENMSMGDMDKEDIIDFYQNWIDLLQNQPGLRIGTYAFEDGNKMSIDLTVAVQDEKEAAGLGEKFNQESVVNVKKGLETDWEEGFVETGGDGESPIDEPDEVLDALEEVESLVKRKLKQQEVTQMDMGVVYETESGRRLTGSQIAYMALHGEIKPRFGEQGFMIDGELATPVEE